MGSFKERTTALSIRVIGEMQNMVELRCVTCDLRFIAPKGEEDSITCKAPGCLEKRRA
ncbi:hypothetical protein LHP98_04420 [Rhodobacter sp. Har01]|uniref:hypothetical protein n=1 Tax=Rhodobacter sp. Har01 TaxID=2883999 RepID=UPI001D064D41|nr:hypothetical protein [Rhodobacter sp. Har01]MCB6177373.1 hypothetical protein [Rhodobacter sp. Har01]